LVPAAGPHGQQLGHRPSADSRRCTRTNYAAGRKVYVLIRQRERSDPPAHDWRVFSILTTGELRLDDTVIEPVATPRALRASFAACSTPETDTSNMRDLRSFAFFLRYTRTVTAARKQLLFVFTLLYPLACLAHSQESYLDQQYEAAQRALTAGNYPEAQRAFEELAQAHPEIAEIHANLGLIYFEERKFEKAIPELRRALKLKPALSNSATILAMSLSELGRYSEALPGLENGFRSADREMKRMCGLQLERAYTGLHRDSNAVEVALELASAYPNDPEILYHNGKIFGNFAYLTMRKLREVAPESAWRHLAAAEAYESQGSNNEAAAEYRRVLALDRNRPGIHYRLARALLAGSRQTHSIEEATEAQKEFLQELEDDPLNANAAYELAEEHRKAGEFEEAQKFFDRALSHYPDFEEAQVGIAATLMSLRKPEEALAHLRKAVELNPTDEVAWFRLAQVYRTTGNAAEQQKALLEYHRLHEEELKREGFGPMAVPSEVTKQEVDASPPQ